MTSRIAPDTMSTGQALYQKARRLIPGGTQLLSKRPERFLPDLWPAYYSRAKGATVWDLDGREYLDMGSMGVGACVLGYADDDVNRAVSDAVQAGSMCTLNCPEEVELSERLLELHPWARMVRLARGGGEAMAMAVRIARAFTGRDRIAFCGYHGWGDWYLAANLADTEALDGHCLPGLKPAGIPRGLRGTAIPFRYNVLEDLQAIVAEHPGQLAAIVLEPVRSTEPAPGFLEGVREAARRAGAVLIFDEVTAGWRMTNGGVHLRYGVQPDVAVFAKALGNGYPIAAVMGVEPIMQAAQTSFISSTPWSERIGPAAALATISKFQRLNVSQRLIAVGERIQHGWTEAARRHHLPAHVEGIPPLGHLVFEGQPAAALETLFTQWMLEQGILASGHCYVCYAHRDEDVTRYLDAADQVFARLARAIEQGTVEVSLRGPVRQPGFQRLT